jgi:ATP-dependent helicase HrpB
MLLRARAHGWSGTALAVAALLGNGRDPDRERGSDADLARKVEQALRTGGRVAGAAPPPREAERVRRQLARLLGERIETPRFGEVGPVTSLAYPDRLAQARPGGPGSFRLANGRGARLDPLDPLAREPWLAVAELDDSGAEARIRLAAPLRLEEIEALHGDRFVAEEEIRFDPREGAVVARSVLRLEALVIKEQPLPAADPERIARALCAGLHGRGLEVLPWTPAARQLQARVALLRRRDGPDLWPDLGDAALAADLELWLGPYLSGLRRLAELAGLDLLAILQGRLDHRQRQTLDRRAPARIEVASGRTAAIDYTADPPALSVKLQELFGLAATPAVDGGRTPLMLQLLSPAQRPVAVTQDLAGFWARTYPQVRKELRGRYPKHPWPDDPLTATPTARAKRAS